MGCHGRRRLIGSVWPDGEAVPADHRVVLVEGTPGRQHASTRVGRYHDATGQVLELGVAESAERGRHLSLALGGELVPGPVTADGRMLTSAGRAFDLGGDWKHDGATAPALLATYEVKGRSALDSLRVGEEGVWLNGSAPGEYQLARGELSWSGGPAGAVAGRVTLLLDPVTLYPALFGTVDGASVSGVVPAPATLRRREPEWGLGAAAWERLVALRAADPWGVGVLPWHAWERAELCAQVMNRMLARLLP